MDTSISVPSVSTTRLSVRWRVLPLLGILLLAFALRVGAVAESVYEGDTTHFMLWIESIRVNGLLRFYDDGGSEMRLKLKRRERAALVRNLNDLKSATLSHP